MSILLSHLKSYDTSARDKNVQNTKGSSAASNIARVSGGKEFVKGEILKGEVVDLRSNQATIKLSDGTVVQGKMEQDVDLYIGQEATFEVAKSSEKEVQFKLIPQETESSPNEQLAGKALEQAGLPATLKNKEIVSALLDGNLSVDKQTIMKFLKVSYQYPDADIKDLVFLQKHNIPVNETNLTMLQEYQGSEHRIISQIQALTTSLSGLLEENPSDELVLKLLAMAVDQPEYTDADTEQTMVQQNGTTEENMQQTQVNGQQAMNSQVDGMQTINEQTETMQVESNEIQQNQLANGSQQGEQSQSIQPDTEKAMQMEHSLGNDTESTVNQTMNPLEEAGHPSIPATTNSVPSSEVQQLSSWTSVQRKDLAEQLKSIGLPKQVVDKVQDGSIDRHELLQEILKFAKEINSNNNALKQGMLGKLMKHELLKNIFKEELLRNYTMAPKQLENGENVKKYYEKLSQDLEKMNQLIQHETMGDSASKLTSQTEHLKSNLDFMKTINEIYPYIQLPVKFKDQNIHSELYVFSRQKGKIANTDDISLLLHLDMDNLGALDIHLQKNKNLLKAKFYVADDSVKELFESTIGQLDDALSEKGYHLYPEFIRQEKESNAFAQMELKEQESEGMTMKRFTFDIRA